MKVPSNKIQGLQIPKLFYQNQPSVKNIFHKKSSYSHLISTIFDYKTVVWFWITQWFFSSLLTPVILKSIVFILTFKNLFVFVILHFVYVPKSSQLSLFFYLKVGYLVIVVFLIIYRYSFYPFEKSHLCGRDATLN